MSLHAELAEAVATRYAGRLARPPSLAHDALILELANGVRLEARFASAEEYSIAWEIGGTIRRIDTAPRHPALATYPNHLHDVDGAPRPDPLTRPGAPPLANLAAVIEAVLADPALGLAAIP